MPHSSATWAHAASCVLRSKLGVLAQPVCKRSQRVWLTMWLGTVPVGPVLEKVLDIAKNHARIVACGMVR